MIFTETKLLGAYIIDLERQEDSRGFFARTFCSREFRNKRLVGTFVQCNMSWNARRATVRGMHYQLPPPCEVKLVRCAAGALWDVIVDLRPKSPTHLQSFGVELWARNRMALYIPEMFAHGFQTLEDGTEVFYQMSEFYMPNRSTGLRYNDPKIGIEWPLPVSSISEKDRQWAVR